MASGGPRDPWFGKLGLARARAAAWGRRPGGQAGGRGCRGGHEGVLVESSCRGREGAAVEGQRQLEWVAWADDLRRWPRGLRGPPAQ
eukprot:10463088-Alexandrium_andersonii.AAC.1